jgi:hypothetical protein
VTWAEEVKRWRRLSTDAGSPGLGAGGRPWRPREEAMQIFAEIPLKEIANNNLDPHIYMNPPKSDRDQ